MHWWKVLLAAVLATLATAAQAETWRHAPSGISIEIPASLRLGEVRDLRGDGSDVIVQLGSGGATVTFFVYRAAYPNVALWYDRARRAMRASFPALATPGTPRRFTLAGAASPNGLREELSLRQGQLRATGVAVGGYGEWLVKVRITSSELDRAGVSRLMDAVLGGIRPGRTPSAVLPLDLPGDCPGGPAFSARETTDAGGRTAATGAALQALEAAVRGRAGLAFEPAAWCRMQTDLPAAAISVFRRRDNGGWVALLGDAGAAMTALRLGGGAEGPAGVYGSTTAGNQLLYLFDGIPAPGPEVERGFRTTMAIGRSAT